MTTNRSHLLLHRLGAGLLAATLTACGAAGGDRDVASEPTASTPTTAPTESTSAPTAPSTTAPPVGSSPATTAPAGGDRGDVQAAADAIARMQPVVVADGYVTLGVPGDWLSEDLFEPEPQVQSEQWTATPSQLVGIATDDLLVLVLREGFPSQAPDLAAWTDATITATTPGFETKYEASYEWAGADGAMVLGVGDEGFYRFHAAEVDGQYVMAIAHSADQPTEADNLLVDAVVGSISFDASALSPLAESIDVRRFADGAATGGDAFTISVLAPAAWEWADEGDATVASDPVTGALAAVTLWQNTGGFEAEIEFGLADTGAEFFDVEPVREDVVLDEVPGVVLWEGDPATAEAAAVYATDGAVVGAAYLWAPGDHDLLVDMIESVRFPDHAPIG